MLNHSSVLIELSLSNGSASAETPSIFLVYVPAIKLFSLGFIVGLRRYFAGEFIVFTVDTFRDGLIFGYYLLSSFEIG